MSSQNNLDNIEHIVVLMMENRSFDNVLGWLYSPDNPPPFNKTPNKEFYGVNGKMSNPRTDGSLAYVTRGTDFTAPYPDPNEEYEFVYRQMYNRPLENSVKQPPPHIKIPNTTDPPTMEGFVIDYANAIEKANNDAVKKGDQPFEVNPDIIMDCFGPESLPVINGLAQFYAVCDYWFSSVPTQTFPNRSFVHAATSSGNVYNTWKTGEHFWDIGVFINDTPTIYNLLEEAKIPWKVYHGGSLALSNTLITQKKLWEYAPTTHFSPFRIDGLFNHETFAHDVENKKLPAYSFIEPNMICSDKYGAENDMHPAYAIFKHGSPTDVRYGDKLIYDIYTTLSSSHYYWDKTLFIITFDEHGGCFDHIPMQPSPSTPPPPAVAPDDRVIPYTDGWNGGSGFDFTRFGVRVPAVLVSPWIEKGTICHTQFDHTSIIKTVSNKWLGGECLTNRDKAANDLSEVLTAQTIRTDKFDIKPLTPPVFEGCKDKPLSPLQTDMVLAAAEMLGLNEDQKMELIELDTTEKVSNQFDSLSEQLLAS